MKTRLLAVFLIASLFLTSCNLPSAPTPTPELPTATLKKPAATSTKRVDTATPRPTLTPTEVPQTYHIVDTAQGKCYGSSLEIPCPSEEAFFGQDAQYTGLEPGFTINQDGTVTDNNTGLVWQQSPDSNGDGVLNAVDKLTHAEASAYCESLSLAGADDWRLPDIKALYSLIDFRGTDPSGAGGQIGLVPFLDNAYFGFAYGDTAAGERTIDSQFASSSLYADSTASQGGRAFGVNFADGRIKGYDLKLPNGTDKTFFVLCVRGSDTYGENYFVDNGDGTVSDLATGLVWQKDDSAGALDWQGALAYCENLDLAGAEDWRLPDAKSLQSLVDYTRSPSTSNSAAIAPWFTSTAIENEAGQPDYPYYWTSTTHPDWSGKGQAAVYFAFGRAMGFMNNGWVDVHGAGAQRSDPKTGDPADFPRGRGPQGDAIRILNHARCVRGGDVTLTPDGNPDSTRPPLRVKVIETPEMPGPGGFSMPSPEAIQACSSSTVGQVCQFSILGTPIYGICREVSIPDVISVLTCVATIPIP